MIRYMVNGKPKDNDTTFDAVDSPTIDKYHADKAKVEEITGLTAESKRQRSNSYVHTKYGGIN